MSLSHEIIDYEFYSVSNFGRAQTGTKCFNMFSLKEIETVLKYLGIHYYEEPKLILNSMIGRVHNPVSKRSPSSEKQSTIAAANSTRGI